jgi:hypothetical protein
MTPTPITDSVRVEINPMAVTYRANVNTVSITTSLYWGLVEAGVGVFVACLPTLQVVLRQNKWKAIVGLAVTTPSTSGSTDPQPSRLFKMKLGSNPAIQVDRTVDVTYGNADSNLMLTKTQNWVHNSRTEGGFVMEGIDAKYKSCVSWGFSNMFFLREYRRSDPTKSLR